MKSLRTVAVYCCLAFACTDSSSTSTSLQLPEVPEETGFSEPRTVSQDPITVPLSPEESLKTFRLPKGYRLEVVASEPMIAEPAALAWDGNGRLYVAQLETYMQTVEAKGQNEPKSRIMLLEDTDGDGKMDKSSVFLDNLLSPRMLLCVGRELLVNETDSYAIHAYQDTDGDGKADRKREVFDNGKKAYGNIEHQRSGLDWNLDNWIYVTIDPVRFKYRKGRLEADTLVSGSNGQWGLTHDDYGRLYFSRAASGLAATGFQVNPAYGQLDFEDATDAAFATVWPIVKTPDVNGGPKTLRPDSTMFGFTSANGQTVFRGDRLPKTLVGDYLAAEPVGRFIRRAEVTNHDGKITLSNAYQEEEFISSTDLNFRPVNTYTGPDGCLYIVDMYRGIIQESTWAQPGSFLYSQIKSKRLDRNIRRGRIYRLVYEGLAPGPKPRMLDEPGSKLVTYLDHPNGWWRDNAQKEIIVRGDQSVVPTLKQMAVGRKGPLAANPSPLARLHALWTLEGLEALDQKTVVASLQDQDVQVRKAAVRLSEQFLQQDDPKVFSALEAMTGDPSQDVLAQMVLSVSTTGSPKASALVRQIMEKNPRSELLAGVQESLRRNEEVKKYGYKLMALEEPARQSVIRGATIFRSLCSGCHGPEGQGLATKVAPPLISKFKLIEQKEGVIKIMLHGLKGPVDGETYADQMPPMGTNSDEWIASVLNYVRYDLSMKSFPKMNAGYNNWVIVTPEQVKKVREAHTGRTTPWTWKEILNPDLKN